MSMRSLVFAWRTMRIHFLLGGILCALLPAWAAVTPLSFGPSGIGPLTFDDRPTPADGWSQRRIEGSNVSIVNTYAMDLSVQTNSAAGITNELAVDTNANSPLGSSGNTSSNFRWNSARHFLESRPGDIAYAILLLTVRNDSGTDRSSVSVGYDFGIDLTPATTESEDPGLAGHRVYYSSTGQPGSWVHIPELDGGGATAGSKYAPIELATPWEVGANIYFLWADDNSAAGGFSTFGNIEGPYYIDNIFIGHVDPFIQIVQQPHSTSVEQCGDTNFTVTASGPGIRYQWFHNESEIPSAISGALLISNAQASDAGRYFVRVSNSFFSMDSEKVTLTVFPDVERPTILSAVALNDLTNIVITYSERMDAGTAGAAASYVLHAPDGSETWPGAALVSTDGRTVRLMFDDSREPGVDYELLIDSSVTDACGNSVSANEMMLHIPVDVPLRLRFLSWNDNGTFQFRVLGAADRAFYVQGTSNFLNWIPLYTNPTPFAPLNFTDTTPAVQPVWFLRAKPWP